MVHVFGWFFNFLHHSIIRSEILYRCSIPPFDKARDVLSSLVVEPLKVEAKDEPGFEDLKTKFDTFDILQLCNVVPNEVLMLPTGGKGVRNISFSRSVLYFLEEKYYPDPGFSHMHQIFIFASMTSIIFLKMKKYSAIGYNVTQKKA